MSQPLKRDQRVIQPARILSRAAMELLDREHSIDRYHDRDFRDLGNGAYHKQPRYFD